MTLLRGATDLAVFDHGQELLPVQDRGRAAGAKLEHNTKRRMQQRLQSTGVAAVGRCGERLDHTLGGKPARLTGGGFSGHHAQR
jgi:hypothetical protein